MEGREIKRTGYMRGTKAYRVRNWFILGGLVWTVTFTAVALYCDRNIKETLRKYKKREEEESQERKRRIMEIIERNQRLNAGGLEVMEGKEHLPQFESSTEKLPDHLSAENWSLLQQRPCGSSRKTHSHSKKLVRRAKLSLRKKGKENQHLGLESALFGGSVEDLKLNESDDFQSVNPHKGKLVPQHSLKPVVPSPAQIESADLGGFEERTGPEQHLGWQCPTCGETQERSGADQRAHVISCLHQQFARTPAEMSSVSNDEDMARDLARREQEKLEEGRRTEEDCCFCQLCHKDLSHMNSTCRAQHVNRCMDEEVEKSRLLTEAKQELEKAKTAVLDCPMCGKPLKTEVARRSHLKRCAQELQVSTDRLLALVAAQEEERQAQVAAGMLPFSLSRRPNLKRTASDQSDSRKPAKKRKGPEDEETQLAMALSNSLAALEDRQQQQLQPGGQTFSGQTREGRRLKRQRAEEVSTLLLQLDTKASQRRIAERVSLILEQQGELQGPCPTADVGFQASQLAERSGGCYKVQASSGLALGEGLWCRTALTEERGDGSGSGDERQRFYVPAVMPSVRMCWMGMRPSLTRHGQPQGVEDDADERKTCLPPWQRGALPSPSAQCHASKMDRVSGVRRAGHATPHVSVSSSVDHHVVPATSLHMDSAPVDGGKTASGALSSQTEVDKESESPTWDEEDCGEIVERQDGFMSTQAVLAELAAEGECSAPLSTDGCSDMTNAPFSQSLNENRRSHADWAEDMADNSRVRCESEVCADGNTGKTEQCSFPVGPGRSNSDKSKCVSRGDERMNASECSEEVKCVNEMVFSPGVSETAKGQLEEMEDGKIQTECTCKCKSCIISRDLKSAQQTILSETVLVDCMSQTDWQAVKQTAYSSGLPDRKRTSDSRSGREGRLCQMEGEMVEGKCGLQTLRRLSGTQDQGKSKKDRKTQTENRSCKSTAVMTVPTPSKSGFFYQSPAQDMELGGQGLAQGLQEMLVGLVGSGLYADVQLVDKDGTHIPAHKVFLAARCPQMLALIRPSTNGEIIMLDNAEKEELKALLRYVYGAVVFPMTCNKDRLLDLADRLKIMELAAALKSMDSSNSPVHTGMVLPHTPADRKGSPQSQGSDEGEEGGEEDRCDPALVGGLPGWKEVCRSQPKPLSCTEAYDFLAGSSSAAAPEVLSHPPSPCMSPPVASPVSIGSGDLAQSSLCSDNPTSPPKGPQERQGEHDDLQDEQELSNELAKGDKACSPDGVAGLDGDDPLLCDAGQMSGEDLFSEEDDDVVFMGLVVNPVMMNEDAVVGEVIVDGSSEGNEAASLSYSQEFNDSLSAALMECPVVGLKERNSGDQVPEEEIEPRNGTNSMNHRPELSPGRAGANLMDKNQRKSKDCLRNEMSCHAKSSESPGPSLHQESDVEWASCMAAGREQKQASSQRNSRPVTSTPVKGQGSLQQKHWPMKIPRPNLDSLGAGDTDASPSCSPASSPGTSSATSASEPSTSHGTRHEERKTYGMRHRQVAHSTNQLLCPAATSCPSQAYSVLTNVGCRNSYKGPKDSCRTKELDPPIDVQEIPSPEPPIIGPSASPSPLSECELSAHSSTSEGKGLLFSASPAHDLDDSGNDDDDENDNDCRSSQPMSAKQMSQTSNTKRGLARRNSVQGDGKYPKRTSFEKRGIFQKRKTSEPYGITKQRDPKLETSAGTEKAAYSCDESACCLVTEDKHIMSVSKQADVSTKCNEQHLKNGVGKHRSKSSIRGRRLLGDHWRPGVKRLQASDSRYSRLYTKEVVKQSAKGIKIYPPISKTVSYCGRKRKRKGSDSFANSLDEYASSDDGCRMLLCQVHLTDLRLPVGAEFLVTAPESRCKRPRRSKSAESMQHSTDSKMEEVAVEAAGGSSDESQSVPHGKGRSAYWLVTMTKHASQGAGKLQASCPSSVSLSDTHEDLLMSPADTSQVNTISRSAHSGTSSVSVSLENLPELSTAVKTPRLHHRRRPRYRVQLPPPRQRASKERRLRNSCGAAMRNRIQESRNIFNALTSLRESSLSGEAIKVKGGNASLPTSSPRKYSPWKAGQGRFEWGMTFHEENLPLLNSPIRRRTLFKSSSCSPKKSQSNFPLGIGAPPSLIHSTSPCTYSLPNESSPSEPPVLSPITLTGNSLQSQNCSPRNRCPKLNSEVNPSWMLSTQKEDLISDTSFGDAETSPSVNGKAAEEGNCAERSLLALANASSPWKAQEKSSTQRYKERGSPAKGLKTVGAQGHSRRSLWHVGQNGVLLPKHCFGGKGETCLEPRGTVASHSMQTPASDHQDGRESEEKDEDSKNKEDASISGGAGNMTDVWNGFDDPGAGSEDVQIMGMSFSQNASTQADLEDSDSEDSLPDITPLLQRSSPPPPSLPALSLPPPSLPAPSLPAPSLPAPSLPTSTSASASLPPARKTGRNNHGSNPAQVFKTPTPSKRRQKCLLQPPSPFTPMPDFGAMPTPELKKRAEDFGIRALGRKKVVIVLKDIHRQMHQYETDSAADESMEMESNHRGVDDESNSDDNIIPSQESEKSDVQEESFMGTEDVLSTQEMNEDSFHNKMLEFFQANPDLHRDSILYEAHDLETLVKRIKAAGIQCSTEKVIQYLDLRSITYTMKNMKKRPGNRRQRRKPSPKKKTHPGSDQV